MIGHSLDPEAVDALLAAATAAPSMHNTQPWRYRVRGDTVEVYADPRRGLPVADPQGRGMFLGIGAVVFNLRLAAIHLGWEPVVRLLPVPADPTHLASVRLAGPHAATPAERDLYQAIERRHTNRFPFADRPIPVEVVLELVEAAILEGAILEILDGPDAMRILDLVAEADWMQNADPAYRAELAHWTSGRGDRPDGVPASAFGPSDVEARLPLRDFGYAIRGRTGGRARFESVPHIGVLSTGEDTRIGWLRAGQALQARAFGGHHPWPVGVVPAPAAGTSGHPLAGA